MADHAAPIMARLRAVAAAIAAAEHLPTGAQIAAAEAEQATDIIDALRGMGELVVALRDAEAAASLATKQAEEALQEALEESGAGQIALRHHVASLVEPTPRAVVTDPAALPADYLKPRDPAPDLAALSRALRHGPVPGASLSNARPHLRLTARKARA